MKNNILLVTPFTAVRDDYRYIMRVLRQRQTIIEMSRDVDNLTENFALHSAYYAMFDMLVSELRAAGKLHILESALSAFREDQKTIGVYRDLRRHAPLRQRIFLRGLHGEGFIDEHIYQEIPF